MIGGYARIGLLGAALMLLGGCVRPVRLTYNAADYPRGSWQCGNRRVTIGTFSDARRNLEPKVYGTRVGLITAELPIAIESDLISEGAAVDLFVATSLEAELRAHGCTTKVVYIDSVTDYREARRQLEDPKVAGAERIIVGRVRFFRWTQAGFVGLLFQGEMPHPRLSIEIGVQVLSPDSERILWAGTSGRIMPTFELMPSSDEVGKVIAKGMHAALEPIVTNQDFLRALTDDHTREPSVPSPSPSL